ncbi:MAG: hypothetical protein ABI614_26980, partial [Planctomycetota bacterium]
GRLVPVPSSVSPPSPVPADRRPQLDPTPQRTSREGSASRPQRTDAEVFVATLVDVEETLELTPPLVGTDSYSPHADVADDRATMADEISYELLPMKTPIPVASFESELPTNSGIPTDEVWDDSGWRSEQ